MSSLTASSIALLIGLALTGCEPAGGSSETGPPPRAHHTLVHHEAEGRLYLIGGRTPGEEGHHYFDEVWAREAGGWELVARLPFSRSNHRTVYAPDRGSVLLFGGTDGRGLEADSVLREWQNGRWTPVAAAGGAAASEPGACYDRRRRQLVLHGGARPDGSFSGATWGWDQKRLARVDGRGPGARLGHVMFWDPSSERCVLFGGRDASGEVQADTWAWDGAVWTELQVEGPPARWIHTAATDPTGDRGIVFGGQGPDGELLGDTWAWNGWSWRLVTASGPEPRMMGKMAVTGEQVFLFGGRALASPESPSRHRDMGDTWTLREGRWTRRTDSEGASTSTH